MAETGLLLDPIYEKHETGRGHPESRRRYEVITARLEEAGLAGKMAKVPVREARDEEILLCHTEEYLELAIREIGAGAEVLSTGDTAVCPDTLQVARKATGGVLNAVDGVMEGKLERAFCAVRPPGHHATPDRAMGFCVFNNVAVAARHAQKRHGIERVAIIDWDVHHGNGTQDMFYEDGSVYYFSTHQYPWYPGTGAKIEKGKGEGEGRTLNVPLPAGSGMEEIGAAFRGPFLDAMKEFKPELVIVSAGFDSRLGDPLGNFTLTDDDFRELTNILMGLAEKHAGGRLLSVLEGGYHLKGLASAVAAHVEVLIGD